ncbi:MAG: cytochrome P450 [Myxococcota bacterium]|jgi:cytochrome P450|nr:cytochrome P450 [Myxococcota bacterium]
MDRQYDHGAGASVGVMGEGTVQRAPAEEVASEYLFSTASIEDPFPFYATLRRDRPLARIGDSGVHTVATWDLIEEALGRQDDFSANLTGVLMRGDDGAPTTFAFPGVGANQVIATADEPDHAVHRSLVQPKLSPRRIAGLEDALRGWTSESLEPWLRTRGGDFVPVAEIIPAHVVAHLLGLPGEDVGRFRTWAMMGGDILAGDVGQERLVSLAQETGNMADYLAEHLDRQMVAVGDGASETNDEPLLRALARGVADGRLDRLQAVGISVVMFGAAGESTAALLGSCVRRLAEDQGLQRTLRADRALIPRFVEEVVRLEPPFKFHYRVVRRACELGGFALEEGDRLMLLWASANRDAAVFDDGDSLRLDRKYPRHHMSFGRGAHFCVGARLARLEARVVIEALLDGTRALRVGADPGRAAGEARRAVEYSPSIFVRRLDHLFLEAELA